jgi:3-hydroxyisobutyrate dehydrogenase-like beta-hydroxyacid dehydrogenase
MASYSQAQFWLGEGEQARYAKLSVNLMLAVSAGMLGEAPALAPRGNVALADVLDLIAASALGSPMFVGKVGFLKAADCTPTLAGCLAGFEHIKLRSIGRMRLRDDPVFGLFSLPGYSALLL